MFAFTHGLTTYQLHLTSNDVNCNLLSLKQLLVKLDPHSLTLAGFRIVHKGRTLDDNKMKICDLISIPTTTIPTPPPTTTTTLPVILEDNMPAVCVDYPTHTHQCGLPADLFPNTLLFPPRFECYDDSYYNSYEPSKMFSAKHTPTKYQDTNDHCLSDTESAISDIDKLLF
eukprot:c6867_g5_i1.p1 GENE.c6867_g5_i1~~c6867_g5_i1.p1  ORF type:complete len:184 (+),score=45.36 c6867_g5_i1:42-554(+)